ncbi:MAG: hypothetical protein ACRENA_16440 [Vulcanimicrobiaceae bacterium]
MSTAVPLQDISSFVERLSADQIARCAQDLSSLKVNGEFRRFVVARMGSTGSTWLAKLLNSHPDVFCTHEGILAQIYPAQSYGREEIATFLRHFGWDTKHGAYAAVGDIGSVWDLHLAVLPFSTALLVRHPARMLHTRLVVYRTDQSFTTIDQRTETALRELWGIELAEQSDLDRIFLQDLWNFAGQVWATHPVIRIEDLRDADYCKASLKQLTGLDYDEWLIERAITNLENQRSGRAATSIPEILNTFTNQQRGWYQTILAPVIDRFGYALLEDV